MTILKIMLASKNPGKIKQFKLFLEELGIDLAYDNISVIEDGKTEKENAIKKAKEYKRAHKEIILSDDAGIYFDALGNKPGLEARRWMGHFSEDVSDEEWLLHVTNELKSYKTNTGYIKACWCIYSDRIYTKEIKINFEYTTNPMKGYTKGFPLSALLIDKKTKEPLYNKDITTRCDELRDQFREFLKEAKIIE